MNICRMITSQFSTGVRDFVRRHDIAQEHGNGLASLRLPAAISAFSDLDLGVRDRWHAHGRGAADVVEGGRRSGLESASR